MKRKQFALAFDLIYVVGQLIVAGAQAFIIIIVFESSLALFSGVFFFLLFAHFPFQEVSHPIQIEPKITIIIIRNTYH